MKKSLVKLAFSTRISQIDHTKPDFRDPVASLKRQLPNQCNLYCTYFTEFTAHCVHYTGKLYVNTVQFREKYHKEMRRVMITVLLHNYYNYLHFMGILPTHHMIECSHKLI